MAADGPQRHTFRSGDHTVSMEVRFLEPYAGKRLVFYRGEEEICLVRDGERGDCLERFVGAVAILTLVVKQAGQAPEAASIRELVTVTRQSPELPEKPPYDRTQPLLGGVISDAQVFGYDESGIAESEREAVRRHSRERLWRLCRQELFLNGDETPFATLEWRHTLHRIELLRVRGK